ncbi:SDR family oxidoreductase [Undibacterium cyanobacteriorum]|uniref:SDR family oxidoreductase n=1 Tax=Undibacterium cyanobacteriorum TaxID=3073561 RepID=A0ABY9RG93_9BURK|nr:SDR family oxidoreductase [Undibacterium sp. 20NA77.5]WMW79257.1 SDR family oxidoreductase [Undibacterium sp. 20NA77.5]
MSDTASTFPAVLITGANGFVGQRLAQTLHQAAYPLRLCTRKTWQLPNAEQNPAKPSANIHYFAVGDLSDKTDWSTALTVDGEAVEVVVHCAARVHVMNDTSADPLAAFRALNRDASIALAQQAANAGVKHFIYLSSVKVNGEQTTGGKAFQESDTPVPSDPYGISKCEAEQALLAIGAKTGMAVSIIRPPLVYGDGVAANFLSMLRWVRKGIPLPLGAIRNQRSLVYVANLVDFIRHCMLRPEAAQQIYLISDDHDLSTSALLRAAAKAQNKPARLLPVPAVFLYVGATLLGKRAIADRLCGSLQVDISKAKRDLQWTPPYSVEQGLQDSVRSFER